MNNDKSVDVELFRDGEPTPDDAEALLTQYRLFVETSEALSARRQGVNTFFLSVNSIVLAAAGLLLRDEKFSDLEAIALICLSFGGAVLSFVWWRLISSFQQLSKGKFDVIHALERRLPARVFAAEWVALGCGKDPKKYRPFTVTEKTTPKVFGTFHSVLVFAGIVYMLVSKIWP